MLHIVYFMVVITGKNNGIGGGLNMKTLELSTLQL